MTAATDTDGGRRAARPWRETLRSPWVRFGLMLSLPLVVVLAGISFYVFAGRYVSTDDAYVKADKVMLSTDVAGRVKEVDVSDNDVVRRGQVLFRLENRQYGYAVDRARANLSAVKLQIDSMRANYKQKQADVQAAQDTLA